MSLKFGVLGLLVERRSYGYELVQRLSERLGPAWQLNPSAVYAALDQLEDGALIRESDNTTGRRDGETRRRAGRVIYEVTDEGELAFVRWMTNPSQRQEPIRSDIQLKMALATVEHVPALLDAMERERWRLRSLRNEVACVQSEEASDWLTRRGELIQAAALARLDADLDWIAQAEAALAGDEIPLFDSITPPFGVIPD